MRKGRVMRELTENHFSYASLPHPDHCLRTLISLVIKLNNGSKDCINHTKLHFITLFNTFPIEPPAL
jgi:hypothetical protein